MPAPKKNVAWTFYTALEAAAGGSYQANPTLAAGDAQVSIDGGAFANLGTLPDVDPNSGRAVKVVLAQAEMNGDNIVVQFVDQAGAEWKEQIIAITTTVQTEDDLATQTSVNTIDDFLDTEVAAIKAKTDNLPTDPADASDVAAAIDAVDNFVDTEVAAILTAIGTPAGASLSADVAAVKADTAAILVDTGTTLDGRIPAALVGGRMDANVGAISTDATAADNLETMLDGTGGQVLTLGQLRINSSAAGGAVDIDNSGGDAISATSGGADGYGISATGNGAGSGILAFAGATGTAGLYAKGNGAAPGVKAEGGATGIGLYATAGTNQAAVKAEGNGSGSGVSATGGATGHGMLVTGGATSGDGLRAVAATEGDGIEGVGAGTGRDLNVDQLPAALVGGRMDSSVGAMAADTLTASALATDAVAEIQSGLATAAALDAVDNFVDTEIATIITDVAAVKADTAAILVDTGTTLDGRIPAALVGGRMDSNVGAVAANAIADAGLAADLDVYHAIINVVDDDGAGIPADRWEVVWYKNGAPVATASVTSPTLQVVVATTGLNLFAATAMTAIGGQSPNGFYLHQTTTNRMTDGVHYTVIAAGTIDGSARTFERQAPNKGTDA